jgi:hypothetical protein
MALHMDLVQCRVYALRVCSCLLGCGTLRVDGEDAINRKGAKHVSVSSEKALLNTEPGQGDTVSKAVDSISETG